MGLWATLQTAKYCVHEHTLRSTGIRRIIAVLAYESVALPDEHISASGRSVCISELKRMTSVLAG